MNLTVARSVREARSEIAREIQVRERCFDRWVADGKMSDIDAQDRFDRIVSALHYLDAHCQLLKNHYGMDGATLATSVPTTPARKDSSTEAAAGG